MKELSHEVREAAIEAARPVADLFDIQRAGVMSFENVPPIPTRVIESERSR